MKFKFKLKEKTISLNVKELRTPIEKGIGLMFKKNSPPLLFIFKGKTRTPIHSFFCKKFIAIWFIDDKIIDLKLVKPNKISIKPKNKFNKLLEVPINDENFNLIENLSSGENI